MPLSVRPGSRLAGRYLLVERAGGPAEADEPDRATFWRALDELLGRPVALRLLAADDPHAAAVIDAARRAARVADPRFVAILDAAQSDGLVYVVSEWVRAEDLGSRLAAGPMPSAEAARIAGEVARAMAVAHTAGLVHRRLRPESVLLTDGDRVKLRGLAVDAAVGGDAPSADAAGRAADLHAVGALLYAGLTSRWPAVDDVVPKVSLVAAPIADGSPCTPHQVRAAVSAHLDELTCRALGEPPRRSAPPFTSLAELADALGAPVGPSHDSGTGPVPVVADDGVPLLAVAPSRGRIGRAATVLAAGVLASGVGLLAWQLATAVGYGGTSSPQPRATGTSAASPTPRATSGTELRPARVSDFDPEGNGQENPGEVVRATDVDATTAWRTLEYYNRPFGGAKSGVGLVVDLGKPVEVGTVTLALVGSGTSVQIRTAATTGDAPPTSLSDYTVAAHRNSVGPLVTLRPDAATTTRYLLVWLTALPKTGAARWQGGISDLRIRS